MRKPKTELTDEIRTIQKRDDLNIISMVRTYRLITPLYGGGVKAGRVDIVTPVSGKAIRGNLRFWWRAVRGGQFGDDLKGLKAKEDEIFGTAKVAKKEIAAKLPPTVNLHIFDYKIDEELIVYKVVQHPKKPNKTQIQIFHTDKVPTYAAFPLRPEEHSPLGTNSEPLYEDVSFKLRLVFHRDHQEAIDAALWAWESFGGVGARTRRGFGALSCEKVVLDCVEQASPLISKSKLASWFPNQLAQYQQGSTIFHKDIPHIPSDLEKKLKIVATPSFENAEKAWLHLIDHLQQFRHKRPQNNVTENGRTFTKPGRNRWPEPDAIRTKVNPRNRRYPAYYDPEILKYPRAEFGLPIIFELRGESGIPKATLKGKTHNRMGSPLILRPYQCADQQFVGLALILDGPRLPDSELILEGIDDHAVQSTLTPDEAAQIAKRDNNNYDGNVDILQSFIDSL